MLRSTSCRVYDNYAESGAGTRNRTRDLMNTTVRVRKGPSPIRLRKLKCMNSIITAKALSIRHAYAGRSWFYNFRALPNCLPEVACEKVAAKLLERYSCLTQTWDSEKNSEWLCRIYMSAKMIMSATLQLNAMTYGQERNLRLVSPYLAYYSMLSLLRSIVYTLPEQGWDGGKLFMISHAKAINLAADAIAGIDKEVAAAIKDKALELKAARELISYRSPSSGDANIPDFDEIEEIAILLAEVAQFNSELLEASVLKNATPSSFELLEKYIVDLSKITIEKSVFVDQEDRYRLRYLRRKYPLPPNLLHIMTEGHVEDFFGAWASREGEEDIFDPDKNWRLIFDIP